MDSKTRHSSGVLGLRPRINKKDIEITDRLVNTWQSIVNTIAEIIGVPSALIMKLDGHYIEVLCSSESSKNPYKAGEREYLAGLYCERVIETGNRLLVPNALKDKEWSKNPDIRLGMVSYLGFPILWPDTEVFGTICVLDSKENRFGKRHEKLIIRFKELVEAHLALLYKNLANRKDLENILDSLSEGIIAHDIKRHILFFNHAAEEITGYSREDVLGKDCHKAFGGPFCGNRCSFKNGPPDSLDRLSYSINILTKTGRPRRLEMTVSGRADDTGRLIGILASFRDVTDLIGLKIHVGELNGFAGIIGRDPKMLQVYEQIREMSTNDYPVHISGGTGTGKELVAHAIHDESRRGGGPFVAINCAALPGGTIESELFGHVKGAFTGAVRDKKGLFELADNGTLFLDEVSDLPMAVQAKLLRVLENGAFEPVGGEKIISADVRIISATNRDLKHEVEKGNFREDLYYRINVVPIHLPLLRERKNDIPLLIEHFLGEALEEGRKTPSFSRDAMAIIMDYPWPGNVRELQNVIRFALVKSKGQIIRPEDLPLELKRWHNRRSLRGPCRKLDAQSVRAALVQTGGNKAKAARILGVGRATLYRFLADLDS